MIPVGAHAYPRPGSTERISQNSEGEEADSFSRDNAISGDGRYVAFASSASNLVDGDTNTQMDVFLLDRWTRELERISAAPSGAQADGPSFNPDISADGRYVVFGSQASNLVTGDSGRTQDLFLLDTHSDEIARIAEGAGAEFWLPRISDDGGRVAYFSQTTSPETGFTVNDVFVFDASSGGTTLASEALDGGPGNNLSREADISGDGRYVAFASSSSNLVAGDDNSREDIFLRDLQDGTTTLVSASMYGGPGNSWSVDPSISRDGRYVAFTSGASDLVPGDTNSYGETDAESWDVFVADSQTGRIRRASVTSSGQEVTRSSDPSISADGRLVAFVGHSSSLVESDTNSTNDVFVHDMVTEETRLVSAVGDQGFPNNSSFAPDISATGAHVAFGSRASDLVAGGGTNTHQDLYVRNLGPTLGFSHISARSRPEGLEISGRATFSGDVVVSSSDPVDAAAPPELGAELIGAALSYRPEREDLSIALELAGLPENLGFASYPAVTFGVTFVTAAGPVRVEGNSLSGFLALNCAIACAPTPVEGAIGSTGHRVTFSVPLSAVGLEEGETVADVTAYSAAGPHQVDQVALGSASIATRSVEVGFGADPQTADYGFSAEISGGDFSLLIPFGAWSSLGAPGWVRACLITCRAISVSY